MRRAKENKIVIFLCLMLLALFRANHAYPSSDDPNNVQADPSKYQQPTSLSNPLNDPEYCAPTEGKNPADEGWEKSGFWSTPEPVLSCWGTCKLQCHLSKHMHHWQCNQYWWIILYQCMCRESSEKPTDPQVPTSQQQVTTPQQYNMPPQQYNTPPQQSVYPQQYSMPPQQSVYPQQSVSPQQSTSPQ